MLWNVFFRNVLQRFRKVPARPSRFDLCEGPMTVSFEGCLHKGAQKKVHRSQIGAVGRLWKCWDVIPGQLVFDYEAGVVRCIVKMLLLIVCNAWPHPIDLSLQSLQVHPRRKHTWRPLTQMQIPEGHILCVKGDNEQGITVRSSQNNSFS